VKGSDAGESAENRRSAPDASVPKGSSKCGDCPSAKEASAKSGPIASERRVAAASKPGKSSGIDRHSSRERHRASFALRTPS